MKIGKLTYNGISAASVGAFVSGKSSFGAAAPDYTSYQIPGRNGDLMISNNRYKNINVTYPAFIPADFEQRVQAIRNWMRSARSYARIEDNYDLLHFRLGMGKDVLEFEPAYANRGANAELVFDCKPQRFLYSGEEPKEIGVWGETETATGDLVTFDYPNDHGAFKSLQAVISPIQDLNGYDAPWPPGGGKNLFDKSQLETTANVSVEQITDGFKLKQLSAGTYKSVTTYISFDGHDGQTLYLKGSIVNSGSNTGAVSVRFLDDNGTELSDATTRLEIYSTRESHYKTVLSGTKQLAVVCYASFNTSGAINDTATFTNVIMSLDDVAYSPYSNICPISGRTEATAWRTGKNLLDTKTVQSESSTVRFYTDDYGYVTAVPTNTDPRQWGYAHSQWKLFLPRGDYVFSWEIKTPSTVSSQGIMIFGFNNEVLVKAVNSTIFTKNGSINFSVENNMMIGICTKIYDGEIRFMVQKSPGTANYTPYSGNSYPISWQTEAGTVYGGTVDFVSGVLTATMAIVDLGNMSWFYQSNPGHERFGGTGIRDLVKKPPSANVKANILCSNYKTITSDQSYNHSDGVGISVTNTDGTIYIYDGMYNDANEFRTAMNGVQLVYELATPQTYQLTGQQINTLLGLNNVWADSGEVSVEYGDDPGVMANPTQFIALPMIKLVNPRAGATITVASQTMTCSRAFAGTVILDCDLQNAYSGGTNLNSDWSGDFPQLPPGVASISFSNADSMTIIPRWWEL